VLDFSPILLTLMGCKENAAYGAALFHTTVAAGLAEWVMAKVGRKNGAKIAIGGGCAMNAVLMTALRRHLDDSGIDLLEARLAPPNDGGLALGQAWVARQK
jgi:hydrogenase maturation protein HypF